MTKKSKLGRGLESLLSPQAGMEQHSPVSISGKSEQAVDSTETQSSVGLRQLPLEVISRSPYQPRRDFDVNAIEELAQSIKQQGLMQPVVVRKTDKGYELIAGERRWRACQYLQMDTVPALIKDIDDEGAMAMALIENIQREDLNAMEQAIALDRLKTSYELTHAEVAQAVGKSRVAVTNLLRLLNLADDVQLLVENGDLDMGHARALLALPQEKHFDAAEYVISKGLSVRQTEVYVKNLIEDKPKVTHDVDPDVQALMESLSERIGVPVTIKQSKSGKGKLVLDYSSLDELDGILAKIK